MKVRVARLGPAVLGCAAVMVSCAAVGSADPPDPHQPDLATNYCPGGQWTWGQLVSVDGGSGQRRMCDGEKYPDGSYWHEWTWEHGVFGQEYHHDCVSGSSAFPAPPPPGGCDGAIPPAPPAPSAT
ncbi:hypothetical protein E2F47_10010 [Mycobacterium eburneum]|nr:hypothetical protein E2F47_10010 [Mycobacterium eburneum]